jgi:hypothetical protein
MNDKIPVKKILVLLANPKGTKLLRLNQEIREIKEGLQLAKKRDNFQIESAEAVRDIDIHRSILNYEPQIIHFSGHGAGEPGLIFEDNTGQQKLVDAAALAGLFELFADQVECVLLNACYSEIQAKAIAQHINYVIGMSQEIGDKAAIKFAVGFYDALGAGRSVEFAYKLGCQVIRMAGIREHLTPQLLRKQELHGESINTTPAPTSPPQDARKASVVSASPTLTPPTPPVTKQEEPENITKYRQKVEEFASDGVIDDGIESHILNNLQKKLGLTDEQACAVTEEVLEPYKIYKQQFNKKVAEQGYPLGEKAEAELKKLQNYYEIKDEFVNLLKQEGEQQEAEKLRQQQEAQKLQRQREQQKAEKLRQEHENNLRRYEEELLKVVQAQYPLDEFVRNKLKKFQQSLELRNEDVAQIEKPILDNKEVEYQEKLRQEQEAEKRRQQEQLEAQRIQRQRKPQEAERLQRQKQKTDDLPSEKGVNYTKLRDLLAAGKWKDADEETLAVMLKAAGRETERYLDYEDIENFPCTDLRTIDQLWVKYSKGLFGFSVQKRIWESVGKDYSKFGDRVGWRKGRISAKRRSREELTFSLNAPQGHLPDVGCGVVHFSSLRFFEAIKFSSLASRLVKCNI